MAKSLINFFTELHMNFTDLYQELTPISIRGGTVVSSWSF